jgi:protein arginine kinase activator
MLCENCNKREASVHYTEVVNGVATEHHLCSECAAKLGITGYASVLNSDFPFVKLLTGMLSAGRGMYPEPDSPMQYVRCPQCGLTYEEFAQIGKFGCGECYNVFGPLIGDNMKKLHGNNSHAGKVYKKEKTSEAFDGQTQKNKEKIAELEQKLSEAVTLENFEMAAALRDEIRGLRAKEENNA